MKIRKIAVAALLIGAGLLARPAYSQFIKIDDFVNATQANLAGQTSDGPSNSVWHGLTSASVVTVTNSTTPGVGLAGSGTPLTTNCAQTLDTSDGAAYIALPVPITTSSTVATFFMQFDMGPTNTTAYNNNVNWDFSPTTGSDGGGGQNDVELNANQTGATGRAGITIRDNGTFVELSADGHTVFTPLNSTVYNIWFVVNNSTKSFIIYMQDANPSGTDLPYLTRMQKATAGGNTPTTFSTNAIAFRNQTAATVGYFVFGTGGGSGYTTTQFLYSLYEDPNTLDLTNPVTGAAPVLLAPPVITSEPLSEQLFTGATAVFTVNATGGGLSYQWQSNGVPMADSGNIVGSASNVLTISGVSSANALSYSCVITNANRADASKFPVSGAWSFSPLPPPA